jgi:hypothetical protein
MFFLLLVCYLLENALSEFHTQKQKKTDSIHRTEFSTVWASIASHTVSDKKIPDPFGSGIFYQGL